MRERLVDALNLIWSFFKYTFLIAGVGLIIILILLSSAYRHLKLAGEKGLIGKTQISAAVEYSKSQSWNDALNRAEQARESFSGALAELEATRGNSVIKNLNLIRLQINSLEYLLKTAEILSRSLERIIPLLREADLIRSGTASKNFVDLSVADKQKFLKLIYESEPELVGLKANLDLAILNLDKINRLSILFPFYSQISNIKNELKETAALMAKAPALIKLLPALTGYPATSDFLIILQNNDELRPTGGFIGVYGLLKIQNGEIISLTTDDSYHIDMPASLSDKWQMVAPEPISKYLKVKKWYLRDANWSPDWPTSARKIAEIYNGESEAINASSTMFTGVFAITPELIAEIMRIVGPITVQGATYDADNFQPLLQYNVEVAYKDQNISAWDRKEIINELVAELKTRLFHLSSSKWPDLFKVLNNGVTNKSIQVYLFNDAWQSLAANLEMTGQIKDNPSDYFMIVDANLGAFKSDAVVKKDVAYYLTEKKDGLMADLKLGYKHEGGFDWRTTRYRSYTRIYVPLGSRLELIEGLDQATSDISTSDDLALKKTIISFFLSVEPGKDQVISIRYQLPNSIYNQFKEGKYQLLIQKQPGQREKFLNINLKPLQSKVQSWSGGFITDKTFDQLK